ncbi:MAG: EAL domain-containing protein, partial [Lautropia sp.]
MEDLPPNEGAPLRRSGRWRCALVVDDEEFSRKIAARALQLAGIAQIELADSGSAALARMAHADCIVDLVLCDLNMPAMDGIEFLRRLAELPFTGAVVLVSGEGSQVLRVTEELARARRLDVLGVLEKPLRPADLAHMIGTPTGGLAPAGRLPVAAPAVTPDELRRAIDAGDIFPVYQPKIEVATGRVIGAEALARWKLPDGSLVSPDVFIPLAEATGLVDRLTEVVMTQVFAQLREWSARGPIERIAVNVAMSSLRDLDFPDRVLARIADARVPNDAVTLEVTESQLMVDAVACVDSLLRLRLRGVRLAIDDFGTRYASLSQLRALPFTELKIDKSFVHGAATDERALAILESSIALGRTLGLNVVAEGVETADDWRRIAGLGCHVALGYLIARPLAADRLDKWLAS